MFQDLFNLNTTLTLIQAVENIKLPVSFLTDTFFPQKLSVATDYVAIEYRKENRMLAPFLVKNTKGIDIARGKSRVKIYSPVVVGARRTIGIGDVSLRQFGEQPNIYNAPTAEERQARLQAQDLSELLRLMANRKEAMASELLQTGKLKIQAFAEDGQIAEVDEIDYDLNNSITPTVVWSNTSAKIYDDLRDASEQIQEEIGEIPTVLIVGKNIEQRLLKNKEIKDWLMLPNRENLTMANFAPTWTSPQVRHIGRISALNLDIVSYSQTYIDDSGTVKNFIDPDTAIIGVPGKGREIHCPVTIFQQGNFHTISADTVPFYSYSDEAQTTSLTLFSRYVLTPDAFGSWITIKTEG